MGSRRLAWRAGKYPKNTPMALETPTPKANPMPDTKNIHPLTLAKYIGRTNPQSDADQPTSQAQDHRFHQELSS